MSFKKTWEKLSEEEIQGGCELKKPVGKKVKNDITEYKEG